MTVDWMAFGSVGTGIGVVVAVVALIRESRASRFVVGVEMIMRLNDRFESDGFRQTRRCAAQRLQDRSTANVGGEQAVYDVLNFFSMVAMLHVRKALDARSVWFTFGYYLLPYYRQATPEITALRTREPLSYRTLDRLEDKVLRIEERERSYVLPNPDQELQADEAFLREEASLSTPPQA